MEKSQQGFAGEQKEGVDRCGYGAAFFLTGPHGDETHAGPGQVSGVRVMVVVTVVVMSLGSERRAGKHYQDQEDRCCKNLFHGSNVARFAKAGKRDAVAASKEETCGSVWMAGSAPSD
jgi:hypothetical protein